MGPAPVCNQVNCMHHITSHCSTRFLVLVTWRHIQAPVVGMLLASSFRSDPRVIERPITMDEAEQAGSAHPKITRADSLKPAACMSALHRISRGFLSCCVVHAAVTRGPQISRAQTMTGDLAAMLRPKSTSSTVLVVKDDMDWRASIVAASLPHQPPQPVQGETVRSLSIDRLMDVGWIHLCLLRWLRTPPQRR